MAAKCVLVGAGVDVAAHQLFGRRVGDRSHGEVRVGQPADVVVVSGYSEVSQQDSALAVFWVGEQDIGGFDVAMQQPALVGVVECPGHRGDDGARVVRWHPGRIPVPQQLRGVSSLDVVHCDPQLPVELAAIVHLDDVGVPQRGGEFGLTMEPLPEAAVGRCRLGQNFQRVATRQPGMLGEVDLAHPAAAEQPHNGVPGEGRAAGQRHSGIVPPRSGIGTDRFAASTAMAVYGWPIGLSASTHV